MNVLNFIYTWNFIYALNFVYTTTYKLYLSPLFCKKKKETLTIYGKSPTVKTKDFSKRCGAL